MKIQAVNTILYCQRWAETVAFYADVLQLKVNFSNDWFVEFWVQSGARISVANQDRASIKSAHGQGITLTFQIDNVSAMHAYLTEAGANRTPVRTRWGAEVFYVHDPDGNRIEFWA